jgi:hypothetical protein
MQHVYKIEAYDHLIDDSADCDCHPRVIIGSNGELVVIHNSLDNNTITDEEADGMVNFSEEVNGDSSEDDEEESPDFV